MTPGGHVKLDLVELIQMTDDVNTEVWFQEGAACVEPIAMGDLGSERRGGGKGGVRPDLED